VRPAPVSTAAIEQLLGSMNLGVQRGLDPDADNLVAAGTFAYGSMQSPMKVAPPPLCEGRAGQGIHQTLLLSCRADTITSSIHDSCIR